MPIVCLLRSIEK